jgi:Spy/CpxP family protein refolding chaperone
MFKTLTPLLGAALLAATTSLYAQSAPSSGAEAAKAPHQARHRFDCSKSKDPKACEARREKLRAARAEALKACEGKQGAEHRDCMVQQGCAKTKDAAKCEARAKERMAKRAERRAERRQPQGEKK